MKSWRDLLNAKMKYTKNQFVIWRAIFGAYLLIYFIKIFPHAMLVFNKDLFGSYSNKFFLYTVPNILYFFQGSVKLIIVILMILSIAIIFGSFVRISSFLIWIGWVTLYNSNTLISNPSYGYIGWLLLALVFIPETNKKSWKIPNLLLIGAWIILSLGYLFSGIRKFLFLSQWKNGDALFLLYTSPIAREFSANLMLALPLQFLTWFTIILFVVFPFLILFHKTRVYAWFTLLIIHIIVLITLDLTQVSLGIIVFHLFVFDLDWLNIKQIFIKKNKINFYEK